MPVDSEERVKSALPRMVRERGMRGLIVLVMVLVASSSFAANPQKQIDDLKAEIEALKAKPESVQVLANGEVIGAQEILDSISKT